MNRFALAFAALALCAPVDAAVQAKKKGGGKKAGVCASAAAVRSFKDAVWTLGYRDSARSWAACLCGKPADGVAPSDGLPTPSMAPALPAYDTRDPEGSRIAVMKWFKENLPVSMEEAAKLALCMIPPETGTHPDAPSGRGPTSGPEDGANAGRPAAPAEPGPAPADGTSGGRRARTPFRTP